MFKKYFVHPLTVFLTTAVVCFWPVSLFFFSFKNDALTYYYPVRTLIADALHNGELPLWTPYINMGYPLHADMQSCAWSPVVWAFSFLNHYSLAAFHYEMIFYIVFAGIGFYYLCRSLDCSKTVAYTTGIAYQFSGFTMDSVQFFTCISAVCYIPWVILFFRKMLKTPSLQSSIALAICLSFLFTGGYPSMFIITLYVLLAYFIFFFFSSTDKRLFAKRIFPFLLISVVSFTMLVLPALISFASHLQWIERGKAQSLSFVLENSLNPATSLSLLSPFATTAITPGLESQILMRSIYIGLIPLVFIVYSFFQVNLRRNKELVFFFGTAICMIALAWGKFFFLRQIAYYLLPFMKSFRHPALFRFFTIFFMLLIAAASINYWVSQKVNSKRLLKNIIVSFIVLIGSGAIIAFMFRPENVSNDFLQIGYLKTHFTLLNFGQRFLIQSPFIIATLIAAYLAVIKKRMYLLCLISAADLFFAAQLNMPVTVIGSKPFRQVEREINRNPVPFPLPTNSSIENNSLYSSGTNIITGSILPFTKKIGRNDYYITPGNLSMQDMFYESSIRQAVFKNPVLYLAGSPGNNTPGKTAIMPGSTPGSDLVYTTALMNAADSIQIYFLSANTMKAHLQTSNVGTLVFLQNHYPGWEAFDNGKSIGISTVNIAFMGIKIEPGDHDIKFTYHPSSVIAAAYVSIVAFLFSIILLVFLLFKKRNQ